MPRAIKGAPGMKDPLSWLWYADMRLRVRQRDTVYVTMCQQWHPRY